MNCFKVIYFHRAFVVAVIFQTFYTQKFAIAREVACESVSSIGWGVGNVGDAKTCWMRTTTSINEPDVTISTKDESVHGLVLYYNKKIFHLPIQVDETFPNLLAYTAHDCGNIKQVSKKHFRGLTKLKFLSLEENQIELIMSETFDELTSLEVLRLGMKI